EVRPQLPAPETDEAREERVRRVGPIGSGIPRSQRVPRQ
ncbi:hypothetical protein MTO96_004396, partial [Rhipicephalus appendiculatus]